MADTRTPEGRAAFDEQIVSALRGSNTRLSPQSLLERVGGSSLQLRTALGRLVDAGSVEYGGAGRETWYAVSGDSPSKGPAPLSPWSARADPLTRSIVGDEKEGDFQDLSWLPASAAAKVRPWLGIAYVPIVEDGDPNEAVSKFGGRAWLPMDEDWPACPNCLRPLHLFLQLRLRDAPSAARLKGDGLVQLFYCTTLDPRCGDECHAAEPFARSVVVRRVDPGAAGSTPPVNPAHDPFPARSIVAWHPMQDLPLATELVELGVALTEEEWTALEDGPPEDIDKLLGWPLWVQQVGYPECPRCGQRMRLLFQLSSECNVPFAFGDNGVGHITVCPEHLDVLAFRWAST